MLYLVGQIFFCLALVAMVGLLVGWLLRGIGTHQRERELEATWRMRLRQRDTMLSKMATELAERGASAAAESPVRRTAGGGSDAELAEVRQQLRTGHAKIAQLQGRVSKRDAQISQLFAEIRRIGGQPAVDKLMQQVNKNSFLTSGVHSVSELVPDPRGASAADQQDASEATHPEKATLRQPMPPRAAPGEEDELKFIYGVSPVLEKKLFKIGITTYRQIAAFGPQDITRIARALGIEPEQIINENWVEGARQEHLAKYGELT